MSNDNPLAPLPDNSPDTVDDVLDELNTLDSDNDPDDLDDKDTDPPPDDDDLEDKDDKKKDKDKKSSKDDDDDEDDIDLEKDDSTYEDVPTAAALKKEYPEIFKKHPGLRRAIAREAEYTKVFSSIPEAKDARERLDGFTQLEGEIGSGNIEGLLNQVKTNNPEAFGKITGRILQTLHKVDERAYLGVADHVVRHAISSVAKYAKELEGENKDESEQLMIAARLINRFFYKTTKLEDPKPLAEIKTDEPNAVDKERQEFNNTQYQYAINDVSSRSGSQVKRIVEKYIDPQDRMSNYVKGKAIDDVMREVDKALGGDVRFRSMLDRLWQDSAKVKHSTAAKQVILENIMRKAKSSLPDIIKRVRQSALKDVQKGKRKEKDDVEVETAVRPKKDRDSDTRNNNGGKKPPSTRTASQVFDILNKD